VTSVSRQGHAAAVLRPPVSLFMMKDEDEISTTATPYDLCHDEHEEEDDDDMTHVAMSLGKGGSHAALHRTRGRTSSDCRSSRTSTTRSTRSGVARSPTAGSPAAVAQDARGVLEDQRRSLSPASPAGHQRVNWRKGSSDGQGGYGATMGDPYGGAQWPRNAPRCR
jgi:hypothetical protein